MSRSCSRVGNWVPVRASTTPPPNTWALLSTSSRTSPAFQSPHAADPVAMESASVNPCSSSRVDKLPAAVATAVMVASSERSRRVATSGSSRWWRTMSTSTSVSDWPKPMRVPMVRTSVMPIAV